MSNDRLKTAVIDAGLDPDELAEAVGVDAKTISRWLSGRTPYPRLRARVARTLGREACDLWPDVETTAIELVDADEPADLLAAYAHADQEDAPEPRSLLEVAVAQIDLLDLTLHDLLQDAEMLALLTARANDGCQIRMLISDPDSAQLVSTHAERHQDTRLVAIPDLAHDIQRSLRAVTPLLPLPGVDVRTFVAAGYNSIVRVDEQMLVALHLWGIGPDRAPVLHLQRRHAGDLFDQFAGHYQAIWQRAATPVTIDPAAASTTAHSMPPA